MAKIDKKLVRERFLKALPQYDACAAVQHVMADRLLCHLAEHFDPADRLDHVLEIGCGTGILSQMLCDRFKVGTLWANDIVPESEAPLREKFASTAINTTVEFLPDDIERTELPERLDLVISGATLQWISDLGRLFKRLASRMNPGGIVAFSTFSIGNLDEIKQLTGRSLPYPADEDYSDLLPKGWQILSAHKEESTLFFHSPVEVLRHLKNTGVSGLKRTQWSKKTLDDFADRYRQLFESAEGFPLTYRPLYLVIETSTED